MSVVFFGDSLTEGSNCDCSFTDFLPPCWDIYNFAVSGTTIGEYSIYPVDGFSFLKQIEKHSDVIRVSSHIFVEYGSNDVSAIMCGFASFQTVIVSFIKAVDWIRQINPNAQIHFLSIGSKDNVRSNASRMCDYLSNIYFKGFNFSFPVSIYSEMYNKIVQHIGMICDIIYMFDDDINDISTYISDDNIHPNKEGHIRISKNICSQVNINRA